MVHHFKHPACIVCGCLEHSSVFPSASIEAQGPLARSEYIIVNIIETIAALDVQNYIVPVDVQSVTPEAWAITMA